LPDRGRDAIVREALASIASAQLSYGDMLPDRVAALADALVPLGELERLLALSDGTAALVALTRAARGAERSRLLAELATRAGEPDALVELADELPPEPLFDSFAGRAASFADRGLESFVEDEYGIGLVSWAPFMRALGGPEAPASLIPLFDRGR
jgi:hypothetical protein